MAGNSIAWYFFSAFVLGSLGFFFFLPLSFEIRFQLGHHNSGHYHIRLAWWHWQGSSDFNVGDSNARDAFRTAMHSDSKQAGFIRMPRVWNFKNRIPWSKWRQNLILRVQHGLFSVLTRSGLWRGSFKFLLRLPFRLSRCLKWDIEDLELSHFRPEILGQMAAWHAALGYSFGHPIPVRWNFETLEFQCNGIFKVRGRLFQWFRLMLLLSLDLPWRPILRDFWVGAKSTTLWGWRKQAYGIMRLILKFFDSAKPSRA